MRKKKLDMIPLIGLGLGAVFGLAGTVVSEPRLQSTLRAIDSVRLVVASSFFLYDSREAAMNLLLPDSSYSLSARA